MSGPSSIKPDESTTRTRFADVPWQLWFVHGVRWRVARWLAAQSLNERRTTTCGLQIKRRYRRARILVPLGNMYLRLQGAMSEVLPSQIWIEWESTIGGPTGSSIRASDDRAALELPFIEGVSLEDVLRSDASLQIKLQSISRAAKALRNLHRRRITACGVSDWPLSHGDATCRNVIVNDEANVTTWIDFDTRHRVHLIAVCRQADDLRTLVCSCACWLDRANYPALIEAACVGYCDDEVITEMQRLFRGWRCPNVFQLAQAPLNVQKFLHLRKLVSHRPATMPNPET